MEEIFNEVKDIRKFLEILVKILIFSKNHTKMNNILINWKMKGK